MCCRSPSLHRRCRCHRRRQQVAGEVAADHCHRPGVVNASAAIVGLSTFARHSGNLYNLSVVYCEDSESIVTLNRQISAPGPLMTMLFAKSGSRSASAIVPSTANLMTYLFAVNPASASVIASQGGRRPQSRPDHRPACCRQSDGGQHGTFFEAFQLWPSTGVGKPGWGELRQRSRDSGRHRMLLSACACLEEESPIARDSRTIGPS